MPQTDFGVTGRNKTNHTAPGNAQVAENNNKHSSPLASARSSSYIEVSRILRPLGLADYYFTGTDFGFGHVRAKFKHFRLVVVGSALRNQRRVVARRHAKCTGFAYNHAEEVS